MSYPLLVFTFIVIIVLFIESLVFFIYINPETYTYYSESLIVVFFNSSYLYNFNSLVKNSIVASSQLQSECQFDFECADAYVCINQKCMLQQKGEIFVSSPRSTKLRCDSAIFCDDFNECTLDQCEQSYCMHYNRINGTPCGYHQYPNAVNSTCDGNGNCRLGCIPGTGDCNNNVFDGCETTLTTIAHCGACGVNCTKVMKSYNNPYVTTVDCVNQQCQVTSCASSYPYMVSMTCGNATDIGSACSCVYMADTTQSAQCVDGMCQLQCNPSYLSCPQTNNGISICNIHKDSVQYCGSCTNNCTQQIMDAYVQNGHSLPNVIYPPVAECSSYNNSFMCSISPSSCSLGKLSGLCFAFLQGAKSANRVRSFLSFQDNLSEKVHSQRDTPHNMWVSLCTPR